MTNASWPVQVKQHGCWQWAKEKRSQPQAPSSSASSFSNAYPAGRQCPIALVQAYSASTQVRPSVTVSTNDGYAPQSGRSEANWSSQNLSFVHVPAEL